MRSSIPAFASDTLDLNHTVRGLLHRAAREAAAIALADFRPGAETSARVRTKHGGSPVSDADLAVDRYLRQVLSQGLPQAGWLSEESADDRARLDERLCWVVDPIDGTRAFIAGERSWTICIALVADGRPVVGVVYAPALDLFYEASEGEGALLNGQAIAASTREQLAGARVAGPKGLLDMVEREAGTLVRLPRIPSLALRLARVGEGEVDAGLVSASASDWDIAAADLIIHEAGGRLSTLEGRRPIYNLHAPEHEVLVASGTALHAGTLATLNAAMGRGAAGRKN
ncbi:inositol monophosphatase family protein [Chelatococcus reniformis]|uniref:3'(2'),5'-bisphosphate nucleotidase CysQ n=1 Tax=Chelatococcus reniformis TaxID=1494448 RepID=A0A916UCN2_9HYPH|nr:3'(2'),5'-bisphosphate nucleotidase CysQ [Chelatococcus reniformis]GGC67495.1 3'(2'),5'-bisphosphate nucleotidase CysQ [Chelatococcus reniformis]